MTREEVLASIDAMPPSERVEVSAEWLARIRGSSLVDPWTYGFSWACRNSDSVVGKGGFKGPPSADGVVEIAYGVFPDHQGKGYATEGVQALVAWALSSGQVRVVWAHTFAEANASARVLTKCGFVKLGEVMDPEDGRVWRWEKAKASR